MPNVVVLKPYSHAVMVALKKENDALSIRQLANRLHMVGWEPPIPPLLPVLDQLLTDGLVQWYPRSSKGGGLVMVWNMTPGARFRVGKFTKGTADDKA
jgi:hypothetical protein